jgi:hypothetical protein
MGMGGGAPPPGIFGGGGGVGSGRASRPAPPQAAAAAAEARAAAAAAAEDEAPGTVVDSITGELRPAAAQGRVQRLDGGDEGDLWRGMQGMGIGGGGYQMQGRGAYSRGPASNPYYEQMFRSRGPLGAMRQRGASDSSAPVPAGYGGASNAATLGGGGAASAGGGGGGGHPSLRGAGGSTAEQLLMQARMQQQMAMQAMGQGAMSEPRPQRGAPREWNHFFQGR